MRSIRPQTVTLVVLAILFGLAAAYTAKIYMERPVVTSVAPAPPPAPAPKTAIVLCAVANLPFNSRIREQDVMFYDLPVERVPVGAMRVTREAVGRVVKVKSGIKAGAPLFDKDLYEMDKVPVIADLLEPGQRAVTLRVDDPIAGGGALQNGAFIDVSLTFDPEDGTELQLQRVLHHLRIVTSPVTEGGLTAATAAPNTTGRSVITVAATAEEANRLILAQRYGNISVTLCGSGVADGAKLPEKEPSADEAKFTMTKEKLLDLPPKIVPEQPQYAVAEIVRNGKIETVVFNQTSGMRTSSENEIPQPTATGVTRASKTGECKNCKKKGGSMTPVPDPNMPRRPLPVQRQNGVSGQPGTQGQTDPANKLSVEPKNVY